MVVVVVCARVCVCVSACACGKRANEKSSIILKQNHLPNLSACLHAFQLFHDTTDVVPLI